MSKIVIDPLTRVSGLLSIDIEIENNKIIEAKVGGNQFRGFEKMFQGRNPLDLIYLTPRICGICSTHHAIATVKGLENAMNIIPDFNGKVVRDIANGFELLQNYLRHIYFFVFPDYVNVINVNPLFKTNEIKYNDYRLNNEETNIINTHYLEAIQYSRDAHRALAICAGKAPHPHGVWIGGSTTNVNVQQIEGIKYTVSKIKDFIENKLIADIEIISDKYSDYYRMGQGYGNLMSFGLYDDYDSPIKYSTPTVRINGEDEIFDVNNIIEDISRTWAESTNNEIRPYKGEIVKPNALKDNGYSWVNAPRYKGNAMEVGALARMTLSGQYNNGISVMDRIVAKVFEAKKICEIIEELIKLLKLGRVEQKAWEIPKVSSGTGLVEAERGSLGHWIWINNGVISNYVVISPSTWNLSPSDNNGIKGVVEKALIGTTIQDEKNPVEIGRIVRSFDPCLNCAAHVVSSKYKPLTINIL